MSEQTPELLSLDDFTSVRLQNFAVAPIREAYAVGLLEQSSDSSPTTTLADLEAVAAAVPYERIAITDIALSALMRQLETGVTDAELSHDIANSLAGGLADFLWREQDREGRRTFVKEMYDDFSAIAAEACKPWPVANRMPQAPAEQEAETEQLAAEPDLFLGIETHAEIAAALPSILPRLERPKSEHATVYKRVTSVHSALEERRKLSHDAPERTATDCLAQRVLFLERNFLANPEDTTYREYYTPAEIIALTDKLFEAATQKNNPEYIAGIIERATPIAATDPYYAERDEDYYFRRPDDIQNGDIADYGLREDREFPAPPTWDSHEDPDPFETGTEIIRAASEKIHQYMFAGLSRNVHRKSYLFNVADMEGENAWPGLRDVYQFICDEHAQEVLGALRQTPANNTLRQACDSNVKTILNWQKSNAALLAKIPSTFFLEPRMGLNKSTMVKQLEVVPAKVALARLIGLMRTRFESSEDRGTLKSFTSSPQAFYKLQIAIGRTVEDIKRELPEHSGGLSVTPIEPLV